MASCVIKFGATPWIASIAASGGSGTEGKGIRVKDLAKVEVKMLVDDMVSKETEGPSFHWVSGYTPFVGGGRRNIEATWVWEAEFLDVELVVVSEKLFCGRIMLLIVGSRFDICERSGGGVYAGALLELLIGGRLLAATVMWDGSFWWYG